MNDISDLASLNFEDLAQADLFDLVTSSSKEEAGLEEEDEEMRSRSCSPAWPGQEQRYTSITLINGEQICLRDTETRAHGNFSTQIYKVSRTVSHGSLNI